MPPVTAFWLLTMYNGDYFFVNKPLNRYSLSSRNKFKVKTDGSVGLCIREDSPGRNRQSQLTPGFGRKVHPDAGALPVGVKTCGDP
jgi:hypothetical protein